MKKKIWRTYTIKYQTVTIKIIWYWDMGRQIDQWNRTESPETDLTRVYCHLIYDKSDTAVQGNGRSNHWYWSIY